MPPLDQTHYRENVPSRSRKTVWSVPIVAVALLFGRSAAADGPVTPDFTTLVRRAEKALQSNDPLEAATAYRDALSLRFDPTIAGRLGLVLIEMQQFDIAAHHLHSAVESPTPNVSDAEYGRFVRAYKRVLNEVCRVEITIDHRGARLEVDGQLQQEGKGEYWFFTMPGTRELRVTLDGFEEERKTITVEKGRSFDVAFSMRPLPKPEPIAPPPPQPKTPAKPILKTISPSKGGVVVGAGFGLVFNATPTAAIGPHIFASWRSNSWWELSAELRTAWTIVEDKRFPDTRFVTWSGIISPCARRTDRWFACALLQIDGLSRNNSSEAASLPGIGLRGGVEFSMHEHLRIQALADIVAHHRGFRVRNPAPWESSPVVFALGIRGAYKF